MPSDQLFNPYGLSYYPPHTKLRPAQKARFINMEIEQMEAPSEKKARWMNDNDLNKPLVLTAISKLEDGQIELIFQTPLLENIRRTTSNDKPEYAFIYNSVVSGTRVFKYTKKNGFRTVELV